MNNNVLYVVYDRKYHQVGWFKKVYKMHTWITAVGVYGGDVNDLLDHYCYNSVATFKCLIPEEDMETYLKDLRTNHGYEYQKLIDMLIDMNSTLKYKGHKEYLLNRYCLSKINNW